MIASQEAVTSEPVGIAWNRPVQFEVVGFSAARPRAEALEPQLNAAILEIGENSTYDSIST